VDTVAELRQIVDVLINISAGTDARVATCSGTLPKSLGIAASAKQRVRLPTQRTRCLTVTKAGYSLAQLKRAWLP
jgi:hypothetical protein